MEDAREVLDEHGLGVLLVRNILQYLDSLLENAFVSQYFDSQELYVLLSLRSFEHVLQQVSAKVFALSHESLILKDVAKQEDPSIMRSSLSEKFIKEIESLLLDVRVDQDLSYNVGDVVFNLLAGWCLGHSELSVWLCEKSPPVVSVEPWPHHIDAPEKASEKESSEKEGFQVLLHSLN